MRTLLTLSIASTAAACATGQSGSSAPVSREEMLATEATYAYDALRELRPLWLQRTVDAPEMGIARRPGSPPPTPSAYACLNMAYVGAEGVRSDDLRRLLTLNVLEVRLIPARARRPDGSRCSHDRPAIHVILVDGASIDTPLVS